MKYHGIVVIIIAYLMYMPHSFAQTIQVVTDDFPPYSFVEKDKVVGRSTEVVEKALKLAGFDYTITSYPWARAFDMALKTENTLIFVIARSKSREKLFKWVSLLHRAVNIHLLRRAGDTTIAPTTLQEARKYRIVAVRKNIDTYYLQENTFDDSTNLIMADDFEVGLRMLLKGRADLFSSPELATVKPLRALGLSPKTVEPVFHLMTVELYAAFNKNTDDKIVERLRRAFQSVTGIMAE